jgi:hypothetical protein
MNASTNLFPNLPVIDFEALIATQKRNLDAVIEANRVAAEGLKAIAVRQDAVLKETVEQLKGQAVDTKAPEKYVGVVTSMASKSFEQIREIADLTAKANKDVLDLMTRRTNDAIAEIQAAVKVTKA